MIDYNDLVNGLFETIGAVFLLNHVRTLLRDKAVKGVSVVSTTYFFAWGVWNVYFYPINGLWFSFGGGVLLMLCNAVYVGLLIYYSRKSK